MSAALRSFTSLNRNEYSMSREDDFAQTASVRNFVLTGRASETDLFRMGINADEPFRTTTFTDDPEELQALASQSTKRYMWVGYADGAVIAMEDAGVRGAWGKVASKLKGYIACQRIDHGRDPEAVSMDRVSVHHVNDLPPVPLSNPCGNLLLNAEDDKLPREVRWVDGEDEEAFHFPYIEGVTESALLTAGQKPNAPTCD